MQEVPYVADLPPRLQPVPAKPIFFDLAFHEIVEAEPEGAAEARTSGRAAASDAEGGVDAESGIGLVKGLLGSWWGGVNK